MKKVSTAAAEQSRNISQQTLTVGLDLGDRNSWYCMLDEAGQLQREQRVRTTAKELREVLRRNAALPNRVGDQGAFAEDQQLPPALSCR